MLIDRKRWLTAALALSLCAVCLRDAGAQLAWEHVWTHRAGGAARAEIVAHDVERQSFFVVNGDERCVTRLDARTGRELGRFDVSAHGDPTSVAVRGRGAAVAVVAPKKTDPGHVLLFAIDSMESPAKPLAVIEVGPLPDMLILTPNGRHILVANEGEPSEDYTIDPEGSISVIHLSNGSEHPVVRTADFRAFNMQRDRLERDGVRLSGPSRSDSNGKASVAQDLEPEYIAVSPDGRTAWVALQENNAYAEIDVASAQVKRIIPLGLKDHSTLTNGLDASDRDGGIYIRPWPVFGMYQPDGMVAFEADGTTYLATANEGDTREWGDYRDDVRVAGLSLGPSLLATRPQLQSLENLGRLRVDRAPAEAKRLVAFGARSMSIWTTDGRLVYDSGDALEQFIAKHLPERFNMNEASFATADSRSPVRGPEPEGIVIGRVGGSTYAFVGLERPSAVAVFDVSRPATARLLEIVPLDVRAGETSDPSIRNVAPEGLAFVPAEKSPLGDPLLAVACEVSGTTILYRVRPQK